MNTPSDCKSIEEVREAIDKLDQKIIALLGERYEYVKEVIRFKEPNETSIVAKDRFDSVIASRRELAKNEGLDPDVIENIYRDLLNYFISEERKLIGEK